MLNITQLAESGKASQEDQRARERSQEATLLKEKEVLQRRLAVEEEKRKRVAAHAATQRATLVEEKEKREALEQQLEHALEKAANNQLPSRNHLRRACTQQKKAVQRPPITVSLVFNSVFQKLSDMICIGTVRSSSVTTLVCTFETQVLSPPVFFPRKTNRHMMYVTTAYFSTASSRKSSAQFTAMA